MKQHYENDAIMNMKRSDPSVPLPVVAEVDSITSWDMENARIYTAVQIKRLPTRESLFLSCFEYITRIKSLT